MSREAHVRALCPATAHVSVAGSALPRVLAAAPPRLAPELAQPTPDSPMRAPKDLPRAILAYGHGSGRESGMLSHICVAYLAISRPGPPLLHASISLYLVMIGLGWGMEASPGVHTGHLDLLSAKPAWVGRGVA